MTLRSLRRAVRYLALSFALMGFVALVLDATPQVVLDETETESTSEIEDFAVEVLPPVVAHVAIVGVPVPCEHSIRETEVLTTRNVTFRIDRPPPA